MDKQTEKQTITLEKTITEYYVVSKKHSIDVTNYVNNVSKKIGIYMVI